MLPIVRKRVLQIPHGLATVAAGICLVLAFSTDIQNRQDQIMAERQDTSPVNLLAGSEESRSEPTPRADPLGDKRSREAGNHGTFLPMFPWFPGIGINGR
jgi:hypothetical protein